MRLIKFRKLTKLIISFKFLLINLKFKFAKKINYENLNHEFNVINKNPFIGTKKFVISESECDYIKSLAKNKLQRSTVNKKAGKLNEISLFRTSSSYDVDFYKDAVTFKIVQRISRIINYDYKLLKSMHISYYKKGELVEESQEKHEENL